MRDMEKALKELEKIDAFMFRSTQVLLKYLIPTDLEEREQALDEIDEIHNEIYGGVNDTYDSNTSIL